MLFGGDPVDRVGGGAGRHRRRGPEQSGAARATCATPSSCWWRRELATSKSDARRLLQQGSVRANERRLGPEDGLDGVALLHGRYVLLRKGKRAFHLVEISGNAG